MQLSSLSTYKKINEVCQMYKVVSKSPLISMRSCVPHISTCPVDTDASSQLVQNCTRGQYDLVAASNNVRMLFRNRYCAQCNGYNDTQCLQNVTNRNFFRGMRNFNKYIYTTIYIHHKWVSILACRYDNKLETILNCKARVKFLAFESLAAKFDFMVFVTCTM